MPQPLVDQLPDRGAGSPSRTERLSGTSRDRVWALGIAATLGIGIWIRTLPAGSLALPGVHAFACQTRTTVNLYFRDGAFLFPVSHRLAANDQLPRAALEALLAGPSRSVRLKSAIPRDVGIRALSVVDHIA